MDAPFSITVYISALFQSQQTSILMDAMASDLLVRLATLNGHVYENFCIHGFDSDQSDVAVNGMFCLAPTGRVPVEFSERIEVRKEPNALFGGIPPWAMSVASSILCLSTAGKCR